MSSLGGASGYLSGEYAEALRQFGKPMPLAGSGGWLFERPVGETGLADAMGPYPLLACRDWSALADDLASLGRRLVSVTAVADPLGSHRPSDLERAFPHLLRPFKDHFLIDLDAPPESFVHPHHQRNARKALRALDVSTAGAEAADEWARLYSNLVARHRIGGVAAFSPASLRQQVDVPGATLFLARKGGEAVGATLWYAQGDAAYYHLGAYSDEGYALRASFALFRTVIAHYSAMGLRVLSLGAGAGLGRESDDGLTRFKRGWATRTAPAFLCGRILDDEAYRALSSHGTAASGYFPAYRAGEFG